MSLLTAELVIRLVVFVLLLLSLDVDLHVPILAPTHNSRVIQYFPFKHKFNKIIGTLHYVKTLN